MQRLTKEGLKTLTEKQTSLCVSLYLPTHRALPETRQDPIRFKNLLSEAERRLSESGLPAPELKKFLQPAQRLLEDNDFWRHQSDGLALFRSADVFRHYRLPASFAELVVVADRFHLKPLLQVLSNDGRFYVLTLSQKEARLWEGSRYGVEELVLENLPAGLDAILAQYDLEKQLQFHTGAAPTSTGRAGVFHGQGQGEDAQHERLTQYFRQVDAALRTVLKDERSPLLFAGVAHLFPLYQAVNTYPQLREEIIPGNPESFTPQELQARAWQLVQPIFAQAQQAAAAHYHALAGTGRTSNSLEEIVPAAHHGRIETLFVAVGVQQWGNFDPEKNQVHLHEQARPNDADLLDLAALQTLSTGGTVYTVEPGEVPAAGAVAAVFRY